MRALKAAVACVLILLSGCRKSTEVTAAPQSVENVQPQVQTRAGELPDCDLPPKKLETAKTAGNHRVLLKWNPSASSSGPNDPSVGYCLYRSNEDIRAKDLKNCENCERVNRRPIVGSGCIDANVKDGLTYYYVAGSTRIGSAVQELSHKTSAIIPTKPKKRQTSSQYPLCQADGPPETAATGGTTKP